MYKNTDETDRPQNAIDHRQDGGPLLSYVWCEDSLQGQDLYLGAEVARNGKIYCIPGHAPRVMKVDPETDRAVLIGPVMNGKYKWLRGVLFDNIVYGIPCHGGTVLKITVSENEKENPGVEEIVEELPIEYEATTYLDKDQMAENTPTESYREVSAEEHRVQKWKYHGGSVSPVDGCIYCIPQSALHVLKIDPKTDRCTLFGPALPGKYKWYGGVIGKQDGAIYGIPHNSPR